MLLTITTTYSPATDLGYLLHKHPDRLQTFDLAFGKATRLLFLKLKRTDVLLPYCLM